MNKLKDTQIRNAECKKGKLLKLFDGDGLYLWVYPDGRKYWRLRYWILGKEKSLSLGVYPKVSLSEARDEREKQAKLLKDNKDPSREKQAQKARRKLSAENSFESVAREWHGNRKHKWTPEHSTKTLRRLELDIFPKLGTLPISEITPQELLVCLRAIESRKAHDLAHRVHQVCGQIFAYGVITGKTDRNPAQDIKGALKPVVRKHNAHLKADELPEFLHKLAAYDGNLQTKLAMKLLLLTFVRTGELRAAKWSEINLDKAEWRIPAERMKMRDPHIVPLSKQAVAVLKELEPLTSDSEYVFPNQHKSSGYMSENTILYGLYRMGYHGKSTGHGFRATASTILNESGFMPDVIERQLAHAERNSVRAAYNHAQYLPERKRMMQEWADYLDTAASGGKVVAGKFKRAG